MFGIIEGVDMYAEAKIMLQKKLEGNKKVKYPTNTNSLGQEFIIKHFAPCLNEEDLRWLIAKRAECKAATKEAENGERVKVDNWFSAFRSAVGEKFFPEFGEKKVSKKNKVDENAKFLEDLLAQMAG